MNKMESKRKKIEVNASSLVELKAELFRKEEELRQKKLNKVSANVKASKPLTNKKGFSWSKKDAGKVEKAQEELAEKIEEVDTFDKSKKALAAKASLYEKLTKGDFVPEEDGSQLYLVDFQQKAIVTIADERQKRRGEGQSGRPAEGETENKEVVEMKSLSADDESLHHGASCPDEEWVDYVDSLGRSRRCMKKDLASLEEMDRELSGKREKPTVSEDKMDLMSSDMKRELERQEWEKEAQMELGGPSGPLHYSNVQFNEVRDHGVGFFGFAKDEEIRQQQLDALKELRNQTRSQREKHDKLKEKRKHMLSARLEKVKQRRIVKDTVANIDLDPMAFGDEGEEREAESIKEPELIVRDDSWRKNAPVREWDKDKKPIFDQESWLEKQREERLQDFAPPVLYEQQQKMPSQFKRTKFVHHAQPSLKKTLATSADEQATSAMPFGEKLSGFESNMTNDRTCVSSPFSVTLEMCPSTDQGAGTVDNRPPSNDVSEIPLPSTDNLERNGAVCSPAPEQGSSVSSSTFTSFPSGHFQPYMHPGGYYWSGMGESLAPTTGIVGQEYHVPPWGVDSSFVQPAGQQPAVGLSEQCGPGHVATDDQIQSVGTEHFEPQLDKTPPGYVAPQPVHYSNAPMKPQPKGPKYTTVNVHEIPLTLPEPPSANFVPHYPSQEEVIALKKAAKGEKSEQANIKDWFRQFDQRHRAPSGVDKMSKPPMKPSAAGTLLRPSAIPFASRYIQRKGGQSTEDTAAAIFDPAKPPPTLNSQ